jgi:hypothetical protein
MSILLIKIKNQKTNYFLTETYISKPLKISIVEMNHCCFGVSNFFVRVINVKYIHNKYKYK